MQTLDRFSDAPPDTTIGIDHYMHGQVCSVPRDATAFPLRESAALITPMNPLFGNIIAFMSK